VRPDCDDGLVDGPVSTRGRFSRCAPTEIPVCRLKRSPREGRTSGGGEWGGGVTSPSYSPSSSPLKDSSSEGVSSPRALISTRVALQASLLCLRTHSRSPWVWLASHLTTSSGKVNPPPREAPRACLGPYARIHMH
jgi:hypothetical protein